MLWVQLMGGLALITFGVRFLRKGFDRLFGGVVAVWLEKNASSSGRALIAGVATGAVAPSSTGLSVLINHILATGHIRTDRMLAVLLGANIGLTILANIVALDVGSLSGVLLFLGVLGFQFCSNEKVRGVGQCLLAFGFVFVAMSFLEEASLGISNNADLTELFRVLDRFPWLLCVAAAVLGVLLQSSTATVGLGIGLAQGGVLEAPLFMAWIVGTNLGLGITALAVSWPHREGRRLGFANLMAKLIVAVPLLLLGTTVVVFQTDAALPLPNQLALAHTGFNVVAGLVALPILKPLLGIARRWFVPEPPAQESGALAESFLDPEALNTPPVALVQATREVLRMTDEVRLMLTDFWQGRQDRDLTRLRLVIRRDDRVDNLNQQLAAYLSRLTSGLDEDGERWRFTLLGFAGELESIGDILEKEVCPVAIRQAQDGRMLGGEEEDALAMLYQKTGEQFDRALSLLTTRDDNAARGLIAAKEEISAWCHVQKKIHYQSLQPDPGQIDTTLDYLDLIDSLRRINKHLATAAYNFHPRRTPETPALTPPA